MEIEILNEKENPLLNRKEIKFRILYEGATPSIKEVRKKLISVLNSKDKLTIVDSIRSIVPYKCSYILKRDVKYISV